MRHAYFLREHLREDSSGTFQHGRQGWECAAFLFRAGEWRKQGVRKGEIIMMDAEKFQKVIEGVRWINKGKAVCGADADLRISDAEEDSVDLDDEDRDLIDRAVALKQSGNL